MIRATRAAGLRGIDQVLNPSARQMRWKSSPAVRASFAFLLVGRVGRSIGWQVGFVGQRVRLRFRLFFLGFRRGIPRAFLLGQLFPRLGGLIGLLLAGGTGLAWGWTGVAATVPATASEAVGPAPAGTRL